MKRTFPLLALALVPFFLADCLGQQAPIVDQEEAAEIVASVTRSLSPAVREPDAKPFAFRLWPSNFQEIDTDKILRKRPFHSLVRTSDHVPTTNSHPPISRYLSSAAIIPAVKDDIEPISGGPAVVTPDEGFEWGPAIRQSLAFLAIQHGYAFTQPKTRKSLRGPFFKDYANSVKALSGWGDGGRFFTNYIAHSMQGSFTGFIQVHNDPRGRGEPFGSSGAYWKSRMKALAWSAAWSIQFEIGPISQASIGNVGLKGKQTYVDIVMTPVGGIGMLITEDILDRYVIRSMERRNSNFFMRILLRTLLNPTRSVANIFRFKAPWYRDPALRL